VSVRVSALVQNRSPPRLRPGRMSVEVQRSGKSFIGVAPRLAPTGRWFGIGPTPKGSTWTRCSIERSVVVVSIGGQRTCWLTLRWQADHRAHLRQRERPAGALTLVRHITRPSVQYDRVVGVRVGWLLVARWMAVVRVNRLGMDLDDPDQCLGRHPGTKVPLRRDRLAFRVGGENEVYLLRARQKTPDPPSRQPACMPVLPT
jgi:hypothetical protein